MALIWQLLQVAVVLGLSPLVSGWIGWLVARVEGKCGVPILQPYYDLFKLSGKESLCPGDAGWFYRLAPPVSLTAMVTVTTLIPVLTNFPLPLGWMGDMLAGGMILGLAGAFATLGSLEVGGSYGGIGAWREGFIGVLVEPALILVLVAVSLFAHSTYPYVVGAHYRGSLATYLSPTHLLAMVAFFLIFLVDADWLPVQNHGGTDESSMAGEARLIEWSGRDLMLLRWSGYAKQMLLMVIFLDVFVAPWGMAGQFGVVELLVALVSLLLKMGLFGLVVAGVEAGLARLRFFRYPEYLGFAFMLAVLAIVVSQVGERL